MPNAMPEVCQQLRTVAVLGIDHQSTYIVAYDAVKHAGMALLDREFAQFRNLLLMDLVESDQDARTALGDRVGQQAYMS